ncbi:carbohydrate sulfotransferase 3-like [Patiria miniata]|uniref:Sulfotransferase domain-containing protein n=1 Tax=Patiria miniata TaxID=46514 RepID=A0A914A142_PATMI|nr:carbohydrate sulfotransferase 3-like [Patiria miniata]
MMMMKGYLNLILTMGRAPVYNQRSLVFGIILASVFWVAVVVVGPWLKGWEVTPWPAASSLCKTSSQAARRATSSRTTEVVAANTEQRATEQVRVLLLAVQGRTGSSFVGELLGTNEDVFYLFEPGLSLQAGFQDNHTPGGFEVLINIYASFLNDLFRCDFSTLDMYLRYLSKQDAQGLSHKAPRLSAECDRRYASGRCNVTQDLAEEICRASKYIVVKSVRMPDINLLLPMVEDSRIKLKVIHLVRDPRPMVASNVYAFGLWFNESYARTHRSRNDTLLSGATLGMLGIYCRYNVYNFELGMRKPSLRDRYAFLRYEDAARNPSWAAGRLHSFLGADLVPESVSKWVVANTKSRQSGIYSTARRSNEEYRAWRQTIPYEDAKAIAELGKCTQMMTLMGYRLLEDEGHLRNMSRSLLADIPAAATQHDWPQWSE